jgi:hypothetical protein
VTDEQASQRARIFARDGFRCVYCAQQLAEAQLTLDHVQPRMRGGDQSDGNLVTACRACNALKGSQPAWSFLARQDELRANFLQYADGVWDRHRRAIVEAARRRSGGAR